MANVHDANESENSTLPGIIILTHGNLGEELIKSASMIFGRLDNVKALPLKIGEDPDDYRRELDELLNTVPEGSLVMVDLFGGTPSNSLMMLAKKRKVYALSGVSMPMLIEAANIRTLYSGQELLDCIVETGHSGIVNITELVNHQSA